MFVFPIFGLVEILSSLRTVRKSFFCTLEIPVTCISVKCINVKQKTHHNRNKHTISYATTWVGDINGQHMAFENKSYTSTHRYEGEESKIVINPNNPKDFLELGLKLDSCFTFVHGIWGILIGIYAYMIFS